VAWGKKHKVSGNVLYLENGLMKQNTGVYIDNQGLFDESSMTHDNREATPTEIADLGIALNTRWPNRTHDPDGHILVCLQVNTDMTLRHCFPLAGRYTDRRRRFLYHLYHNLFTDRKVVIRTHPSEREIPKLDFELPSNWSFDHTGTIGEALERSSHLVTINSTVVTEALAFGVPVATFGRGPFDNAGVTLDCSILPACIQALETFKADPTDYLCKILRHQLPYNASKIAFDACIPLQEFLNRSPDTGSTDDLNPSLPQPQGNSTMKVRRVGDILFIPRPNAKLEAELDALHERVCTLKWRVSVEALEDAKQPELEFPDVDTSMDD